MVRSTEGTWGGLAPGAAGGGEDRLCGGTGGAEQGRGALTDCVGQTGLQVVTVKQRPDRGCRQGQGIVSPISQMSKSRPTEARLLVWVPKPEVTGMCSVDETRMPSHAQGPAGLHSAPQVPKGSVTDPYRGSPTVGHLC